MREKPEMTAFEWSGRLQLLQQIIGPVFNRLEIEWLSVVIDLTLDVMYNTSAYKTLFQDMPEEWGSENALNIVYEGPLAKAQRGGEILDIQQYVADVIGIPQPEVIMKIDWDKVVDKLAALRGTQEFLKSVEKYTEDVNAAREMANADKMAGVMAGAGEALGKTAPFIREVREGAGTGKVAA
jgi:hypothetical protein